MIPLLRWLDGPMGDVILWLVAGLLLVHLVHP
jgi:hypothetical protein